MQLSYDLLIILFFMKLDEDFMATYQLSYGFNPDGTKNENPLKFDDDEEDDLEEQKKKENKAKKKNEGKKAGNNIIFFNNIFLF